MAGPAADAAAGQAPDAAPEAAGQGALAPAQPPRAVARLLAFPLDALEGQRGRLFPWVPVLLGAGAATWLSLPSEPPAALLAALALLVPLAAALALAGPVRLRPVAWAAALVCAGLLLCAARSAALEAPVLDFRFYGAVEGRIVAVDRSGSDRLRLTLDRVVLDGVAPAATPARVRISLFEELRWLDPAPGQRVALTAHLGPPAGPIEPGAFDFRRHAHFERLGAVGYSRTPVLLLEEAGEALPVDRLRDRMSRAVRERIPGEAGGFAAAVTTGDRSGLSEQTNDAMRDANLYHIVSISGMHMGMLAAFVFGLVRYGLALVPVLALRLPVKKIAAAAALAAGTFYLLLAGRDVPTERAYVMVAVMLVAVMLDRRGISLRAVAIAALVVILLRPEMVTNPGFQMSFAATAALVAAFEALRPGAPGPLAAARARLPRWLMPVALLLWTSLVAGLATAPFAALHFNRAATYGLLANLLAVPAMGLAVMPGAVILAVTGPLGLDQPGTAMMDLGSRWILWVAEQVAALPAAVRWVPVPPAPVLPLLAAGGVWGVLWGGRGRLLALAPLALAALLWAGTARPLVLISAEGSLVGVLTPDGRALSRASSGIVARGWLENDGDPATPAEAAVRGFEGPPGLRRITVAGHEILHLGGRDWQAALASACTEGRIVVVARPVPRPPGPCTLYDLRRLESGGAVALRLSRDGSLLERRVDTTGPARTWTR